MEGRSHLLVGLTAGVVLDSVVHLTGDPLMTAKSITLALIGAQSGLLLYGGLWRSPTRY